MTPSFTINALRCAVSIATHNRRGELAVTCQALDELNPAPDEVWIVADGCTDDTVAYIRQCHPWYRLIVHDTPQGHVRSRDEIIRSTDCDIVLVLDDDSHPLEREFIARLKWLFSWRPHLAVASIAQQTDEFPETLLREDFGPPQFSGAYSNASAALRRSVYFELGGYDLDFFHAYDEVDYALRVVAAGYEIYRPTNLTVRHRFSAMNRDEVKMHQRHSRYEQASLWRHCPMPQALAVSLFRIFRQAQYAARRGWLLREPQWWLEALRDWKMNWKKRRPVSWNAYAGWMRLMRRPASSEAAWSRLQRSMRIRRQEVGDLDMARIAISSTNPCHLYPLARVLARQRALSAYYSGYPRWRLPGSESVPVRPHSARTLAVYGALKFLPPRFRPNSHRMFRWQDEAFDRWVAANLESADFIHAMPGQCRQTFLRAQSLGIRTVLNHATGPAAHVAKALKDEYVRQGFDPDRLPSLHEETVRQRREEMALADYHCVASTLVRDQLIEEGIDPQRIWVVPYGADQHIFYPRRGNGPKEYRMIYAGQYSPRKGLRFLLEALSQAGGSSWRLDGYGPQFEGQGPPRRTHSAYHCQMEFHGAIPAPELARRFRESSVLVLPSLEEGFGLVVVQALNCGIPCIVSDKVGAKDLIVHRENGSVFPSGDSAALAEELTWWSEHRRTINTLYPWDYPAKLLIELSQSAFNA